MLYKKILFFSIIAGFFLIINFALPYLITAQVEFDPGNTLKNASRLGNNDPASIAYGIVNWALVFLGIITLIMIIVAGFLWMFAAGEEEKIKKAQDILKGALIGLILILASYGIAQYIFSKLVSVVSQGTTLIEQVPIEDFEIGEDSHP